MGAFMHVLILNYGNKNFFSIKSHLEPFCPFEVMQGYFWVGVILGILI